MRGHNGWIQTWSILQSPPLGQSINFQYVSTRLMVASSSLRVQLLPLYPLSPQPPRIPPTISPPHQFIHSVLRLTPLSPLFLHLHPVPPPAAPAKTVPSSLRVIDPFFYGKMASGWYILVYWIFFLSVVTLFFFLWLWILSTQWIPGATEELHGLERFTGLGWR